ncbi:MAG: hypothetical protein F6K55_08285 [Moorea sp. SIO4A3]|nr:hypothetical protein [Moorena sp. SIO4A3]
MTIWVDAHLSPGIATWISNAATGTHQIQLIQFSLPFSALVSIAVEVSDAARSWGFPP